MIGILSILSLLISLSHGLKVVTYQHGNDGYTGVKSTAISTYNGPLSSPGQYNDNGATFADSQGHWCLGNNIPEGAKVYDERHLIKFTGLKARAMSKGVSSDAIVVGATLSIFGHGDGLRSDIFVKVRYLNKNWDDSTPESVAGGNGEVGWRYFDTSSQSSWEGFGGTGTTDTVSGKEDRVPSSGFFQANSEPTQYTGSLSLTMVQAWFSDPDSSNYGFVLINGLDSYHVGIVPPPYAATPSQRPILTITFDDTGNASIPTDAPSGSGGGGGGGSGGGGGGNGTTSYAIQNASNLYLISFLFSLSLTLLFLI